MLESIIRIGRVSSIDESKGTARVLFADREDFVSYDMPIVVPFTLSDKMYFMPSIDERVLCVLLPNDQTQGFILGSYYSNDREPPVQDKNKFHINFEDGTIIEYDKEEHKLKINVQGDIEMSATGTINIKSDKGIVMNAPTINLN